jgi:N-glycosylase/DNA lyase
MSRRYGNPIDFDGKRFYTFPSVDALASAGEEELRSMKLGFRAKYLLGAARRILDEGVDLLGFRKRGYEESFAELCTYFGIGPKVADCILLFSMDKLEAFPVDRWVRRGIEILYFNGQKMTDKKVREWSRSHFGRYAGYAQEYLFYGARLKELATGFTNRTASA